MLICNTACPLFLVHATALRMSWCPPCILCSVLLSASPSLIFPVCRIKLLSTFVFCSSTSLRCLTLCKYGPVILIGPCRESKQEGSAQACRDAAPTHVLYFPLSGYSGIAWVAKPNFCNEAVPSGRFCGVRALAASPPPLEPHPHLSVGLKK